MEEKIGKIMNKSQEAVLALDFLNNHPGINGSYDSFFPNTCFYMLNESIEGETEKDPIIVYRDKPEDYLRFKHLFDKESLEDKEEVSTIYVTYQEYYNKPWVYDHTTYCCDVTISAYIGASYEKNSAYDYANWGRYGTDIMVCERSFEDMLIVTCKRVKETLGDFNNQSFYTEEEKENHEKLDSFLFLNEQILVNGEKCYEMVKNPEYIHICNGQHNRRWLKWLISNGHPDFKEEFQSLVDMDK